MNKVLQYQIDHVLPQQAGRFGFQLSGPNPGLRTTEHSSWTDTALTLQETYDRLDYSLKTEPEGMGNKKWYCFDTVRTTRISGGLV